MSGLIFTAVIAFAILMIAALAFNRFRIRRIRRWYKNRRSDEIKLNFRIQIEDAIKDLVDMIIDVGFNKSPRRECLPSKLNIFYSEEIESSKYYIDHRHLIEFEFTVKCAAEFTEFFNENYHLLSAVDNSDERFLQSKKNWLLRAGYLLSNLTRQAEILGSRDPSWLDGDSIVTRELGRFAVMEYEDLFPSPLFEIRKKRR